MITGSCEVPGLVSVHLTGTAVSASICEGLSQNGVVINIRSQVNTCITATLPQHASCAYHCTEALFSKVWSGPFVQVLRIRRQLQHLTNGKSIAEAPAECTCVEMHYSSAFTLLLKLSLLHTSCLHRGFSHKQLCYQVLQPYLMCSPLFSLVGLQVLVRRAGGASLPRNPAFNTRISQSHLETLRLL